MASIPTNTFNFSNLETLPDADIKLRRRGTTPGTVAKGTAFALSSNKNPEELFGTDRGQILRARCMVVNCGRTPLFKLINAINEVHGVPAFIPDNLSIPSDNDLMN